MKISRAGLLVAIALALPMSAWAADDAAALKHAGDEAMRNGQPAEALIAYKRASAVSSDPALLYNMSRAYQALGDSPAALESLEKFASTAPTDLLAKVPGLAALLEALRSKVSTLELNADVTDAVVRLNDRTLGKTPLPTTRVPAGDGHLVVEKEGYYPYKIDLPFPARGIAKVEAHLSSKQTDGILVVRSSVTGAVASVDGKTAGTVPTEVVLKAGSHRVDLNGEGYKPATSMVTIAAGQEKSVDLELTREPSIVSRWWFWTAVGVVVVGGAVTIYALTTERDPGNGTVSPGRLNTTGFRF